MQFLHREKCSKGPTIFFVVVFANNLFKHKIKRRTRNDPKAANEKLFCDFELPRGKKILEQLSKPRFFTEFENPALSFPAA